jgi:hypothetical protein
MRIKASHFKASVIPLSIVIVFLFYKGDISLLDSIIKEHFVEIFGIILAVNTSTVCNIHLRLKEIIFRFSLPLNTFKETKKELQQNLTFSLFGVLIYLIVMSFFQKANCDPLWIDFDFVCQFCIRVLLCILLLGYFYSTYEIVQYITATEDLEHKLEESINDTQKTNP